MLLTVCIGTRCWMWLKSWPPTRLPFEHSMYTTPPKLFWDDRILRKGCTRRSLESSFILPHYLQSPFHSGLKIRILCILPWWWKQGGWYLWWFGSGWPSGTGFAIKLLHMWDGLWGPIHKLSGFVCYSWFLGARVVNPAHVWSPISAAIVSCIIDEMSRQLGVMGERLLFFFSWLLHCSLLHSQNTPGFLL